eukprot:GHVQ01023793.1.p1 GENE.GHVQ01023793.1~~GHVQ01023793.1.p1  ORF type:complete len:260 (+),score=18.69 GHVQ01023793.1:613-1392(+)
MKKSWANSFTLYSSMCAPGCSCLCVLKLLTDADTGFGELSNISRTINEYSRAGAAALHIEDQVFPKRCGHLDGKTLLSVEDMCKKVEVAARARDECASRDGEGLVLCARTDAREVESAQDSMLTFQQYSLHVKGKVVFLSVFFVIALSHTSGSGLPNDACETFMSFLLLVGMESAVNRAARYVDAGADMIFPEGLHSKVRTRTIIAVCGCRHFIGFFMLWSSAVCVGGVSRILDCHEETRYRTCSRWRSAAVSQYDRVW